MYSDVRVLGSAQREGRKKRRERKRQLAFDLKQIEICTKRFLLIKVLEICHGR
jgi:hypothetical protein